MELPICQKCMESRDVTRPARLVPLSDYGPTGGNVQYKAWACVNPDCGFVIRADKGEVSYRVGARR